MPDFVTQENGDLMLLEDLTGGLLLEGATLATTIFLTQETGDRFTIETGYGSLLDETSPTQAVAAVTVLAPAKATRRVTHPHVTTVAAS